MIYLDELSDWMDDWTAWMMVHDDDDDDDDKDDVDVEEVELPASDDIGI